MSVPEIQRMLTLSIFHIDPTTAEGLERKAVDALNAPDWTGISVYEKKDYGYFIYLIQGMMEPHLLPHDLEACINYAISQQCDVICFDRDANIMDNLISYEW
jgi:hypothetical protein